MYAFLQDLRYAVRQLSKSPVFSAVAVITLALGLTVNTTIFFMINDLFLRPLPAAAPEQLVVITQTTTQLPITMPFSYPDFLDFQSSIEQGDSRFPEMKKAYSGVMAYLQSSVQLAREGESAERTFVHAVSGNYFMVLGAQPMMGRLFLPNEGRIVEADAIIVLTNETWRTRFASNPHIIGQKVKLNGLPFTVIGVTQPGFVGAQYGTSLRGFVPITMLPQLNPGGNEVITNRGLTSVIMMGRLQQGVSLERARAAASLVMARILKDYQQYHPQGASAAVTRESMSRPVPFVANFLPLVAGALMVLSILVLAIMMANVSNLLYARAADREQEVAIRAALGATRWRLVRQLLVESTLLALASGTIGTMATFGLVSLLGRLISTGEFAPPADTGTDWRLFVFTFIVSLATGILTGLLPALKATGMKILPLVKNSPSAAGTRHRMRSLLVVAQVAFSCVLLICAGLAARSVQKLARINLGFRSDHIFLASVDPSLQRYSDERSRKFQAQLLDKIRVLPGVTSASLATHMPFDVAGGQRAGVWPAGQTPTESQKFLMVPCTAVEQAFLQTLGTRVVAGRDFTAQDNEAAPRVVVINRVLAKQLWPNGDAVGKRLSLQGDVMQVVGLVEEMRFSAITDTNRPLIFYPLAQHFQNNVSIIVHTGNDPLEITTGVRQAIAQLDPELPVYNIRTLDQQVTSSPMGMGPMRMGTFIAGGQGVIALFLATLGLFGLISHSVKRRTHEIGVRIALGAEPGNVLCILIWQGLRLVLIGLCLGLPFAFLTTRVLTKVLYGVQATDLPTFGGVSLLLVCVSVLASYIPARRATSIDPMQALRSE